MSLFIIQTILTVLGLYFLGGLAFAVYFFFKGSIVLDEQMKGASWTMRLLLVPASVALWGILMYRLKQKWNDRSIKEKT
ncbi:MAG: hypothetical protein MI784_10950 [Cytophagales bacterium]|nr:hypothetical protein [Cytophagales bacterium]